MLSCCNIKLWWLVFFVAMLIKLRLFYSQSDENYEYEERCDEPLQSQIIKQPVVHDVNIKRKKSSELVMGDQVISEFEKAMNGKNMSHLTFVQYQNMDNEQKLRMSNRI